MTTLRLWSPLTLSATGVIGRALFFGLFLAPNLPIRGFAAMGLAEGVAA